MSIEASGSGNSRMSAMCSRALPRKRLAALAIIAGPFLYGAYVFRQVAGTLAPTFPNVVTFALIIISVGMAIFVFPAGSPAYAVAIFSGGVAITAVLVSLIHLPRPYGRGGTYFVNAAALMIFVLSVWLVSQIIGGDKLSNWTSDAEV